MMGVLSKELPVTVGSPSVSSLSAFSLLSPPQWQGETQEFCPNAKIVLVGCKLDMRTDLNTLRELSKQRLIPVTHEQVRSAAPPLALCCRTYWAGKRSSR